MNRIVSFGLLVAVIVITGFLFFRVMAGFFLPLFLAALLVVLFRPLHQWICVKVNGRPKVAALLTTAAILLIVLLPFTITLIFAANEGQTVMRRLDPTSIDDKFRQSRTKLGLDMPAAQEFERIENVIESIQSQPVAPNLEQQRDTIAYDITELRGVATDLGQALRQQGIPLEWQEVDASEEAAPSGETTDESTEPITTSREQDVWTEFASELSVARDLLSDEQWAELEDDDTKQERISQARDQFNSAVDKYFSFKSRLLGGPVRVWLKEIANPNPDKLNEYIEKSTQWLRSRLVSLGGATTAFVFRFLFGVVIMSIALFSFLLDGPTMLQALKQLTPLDDDHEDELIAEFDKVSRAVVMATLLSALAQGVLAAIGFYFAGLQSVVLLMLLTSVLALVPFVGAAAVWVPACLFLVFVDGRTGAGIFLGIYGMIIVSGADNVIKPFILHGKSNLHPLWALLSVLGGVSALGPIGILVGPMVVVFLQTLLKILQREIAAMDRSPEIAAALQNLPPDIAPTPEISSSSTPDNEPPTPTDQSAT